MQIKRDFDYYYNLHHVVTHSLLHLLCKVSATERHVPVTTRNDILIKFLKLKLTDKSLANVKKDIKLMLNVARRKGGNLEMKLTLKRIKRSSLGQKNSTTYWFISTMLKGLNLVYSMRGWKRRRASYICLMSK